MHRAALILGWLLLVTLPSGSEAADPPTTPAECIGIDDSKVLEPKDLKERLKGPVGQAREIKVKATAIDFDPAGLPAGLALKYAARLSAEGDDGHFCCWSALWMSEDGTDMRALSDNGKWLAATIRQRDDGTLDDFQATIGDLRCDQGRLVSERERREQDAAESMARLADGGWLVAFECGAKCDGEERGNRRTHRMRAYPPGRETEGLGLAGPPYAPKPLPQDFQWQPEDLGPEAMTMLGGDRPLILSENFYHRTGSECGASKGWLARKAWADIAGPTDWEEFRYPLKKMPSQAAEKKAADTCYEVAGVAPLASGADAFIVLERRFERNDVMHLRLVVTSVADLRAGREPKPIFIRTEGKGLPHERRLLDNFEGIATRPIPGGVAIWLLSDDNGDAAWQKPCEPGSGNEPVGCQRTLLLRFDYTP